MKISRANRLSLVVGLLTGLNACQAQPDLDATTAETIARPIFNGQLTFERPEVAIFQWNGFCTATLIRPRFFLTAAHCIDYLGFAPGGNFRFHTPEEQNTPVKRTFSLGNNQVGSHDLAVGELQMPIAAGDAFPADIAGSTPGIGSTLTGMGYGCINDRGEGSGNKRFRTYVRQERDLVACSGDSGGPVFVGPLGNFGPIGLVFSGGRGGDNTELYADPPMHRSEISTLIDTLEFADMCYRGHVANTGWLPAVCNGGLGGRPGLNDDLQALQAWSTRPGLSICYQAHVHQRGWMTEVCDSDMAGTTGQSLNIQAVRLRLASSNGERLMAQANVAGVGWQAPVDATDGGEVGIVGRGMRGIKIWLE